MGDKYDVLFKVILVGDMNVGKTSIVKRFKDGEFSEHLKNTIGVDFCVQTLCVEDKIVKLQIWDTAGDERYKCIMPNYYRNADAAIIVFDLTNRESFQNVGVWHENIRNYSGDTTTNLLVGNKSDLEDNREVSKSEANAFAGSHRIFGYVETSAKDNSNVDDAFYKIARELLRMSGENGYIPFGSLQATSLDLRATSPADGSWWSCCGYT